VTSNSNTRGSLVALAVAALASSVMLAPADALAANLTALPAEAAGVSNDVLMQCAGSTSSAHSRSRATSRRTHAGPRAI
jgi:hypothetical protein